MKHFAVVVAAVVVVGTGSTIVYLCNQYQDK